MLESLGLTPAVAPVDVDERRVQGTVDAQVLHIAKQKAEAVGDAHPGSIVLVADTMLADPDDATLALGQPSDAQAALAMLFACAAAGTACGVRRACVWPARGPLTWLRPSSSLHPSAMMCWRTSSTAAHGKKGRSIRPRWGHEGARHLGRGGRSHGPRHPRQGPRGPAHL